MVIDHLAISGVALAAALAIAVPLGISVFPRTHGANDSPPGQLGSFA
ncbi:MAG: hypothetical protein ACLTSX_01580 [Collinsella sp.]